LQDLGAPQLVPEEGTELVDGLFNVELQWLHLSWIYAQPDRWWNSGGGGRAVGPGLEAVALTTC
jgi:hypothetical protein